MLYINSPFMKSLFLSRNTKIETWTRPKANELSLWVFERSIFRKIFGAVNEETLFRIKTNQQLHELIRLRRHCRIYHVPEFSKYGKDEKNVQRRMSLGILDDKLHCDRDQGIYVEC